MTILPELKELIDKFESVEVGDWKLEKFVVSEDEASLFNMQVTFGGFPGRTVEPGEYWRLKKNNVIVMSNTPAEIMDLYPFMWALNDYPTHNVLINGLGMGLALQLAVKMTRNNKILVIEVDKDVIKLTSRFFDDPRIDFIHADALTYKPPKGMRFGAVWHDIWNTICPDNLPEMHRLHRKYGRKCSWQGSWCRDEVERYSVY